MQYHFVCEHVLSSEVELQYVPTHQQLADTFTKPLELDKLQHFSSMLGLQNVNVPNLRGRVGSIRQAEFDKRMSRRKLAKGRPTKQGGAGKEKEVVKTWAERVKGRTKDESETTDSSTDSVSDEDESETTDSDKRSDLDEPNHVKAK